MTPKFVAFVFGIFAAGAGDPVAAQETRAAVIEEAQAEKAKTLRPYEPDSVERAMNRIERIIAAPPTGIYPVFGSVYTGGGFAIGPGYRRYYGDRTFWDLKGMFSVRRYKLVELSTESPGHAHGRLDFFARTGWRDATRVPFYDLGVNSAKRSRTVFDMKQTYATGGLGLHPTDWTVVSASASVEDYSIGEGPNPALSTVNVKTPATAPGLGAQPTYVHTAVSAGIDWRPAAGYARRGGLYELSYHNYLDKNGPYSFDRLDAQIVQHVPVLRETWVLSVRGQVQTTLHDEDVVPYFLLPSLGSGSTLRGYSSFRFRDRHSLLGSVEWRWIPNPLAFDMAFFADIGKVASHRGDLDLDGLKGDVGIGARFHGPAATMFRLDLARSKEGIRLVFSGGPAF